MFYSRQSSGFTIVELVLTVSLIALISGIIGVSTLRSRAVSRDGVRALDLSIIQNALNLYFVDNKSYPATTTTGLLNTYLPTVPNDPRTNAPYKYIGIDTNSSAGSCESYHLGAIVEVAGGIQVGQDRDISAAGAACAGSISPDFHGNATNCLGAGGVSPDPCFDLAP